ncbi:MAG TPA: capsule assembly Wzi family protein, partial [Longimicrobiales bacterium]|nr:capsule assembly Wzi family protein [Longimicrobiales bacterium]
PLPFGLAWSLSAASAGDHLVIPLATVGAALGPFDAWVGRQRLHYGVGRSGGVTTGSGWHGAPHLHRAAGAVTGFGIATREPFHFPSFLRVLGPDRIEIAIGRTERAGDVEAPWVVMGRLIGTPFSRRFTLGLNRGAIFGGTDRPVTLRRLIGVLIGEYGTDADGARSAFENQVLSGVIRYRPPVERVLPLELLLEFGADDMAGAIKEAPGIVAGFDVAAVPGLSHVSVTMEHTRFSAGSEGNLRAWYRNSDFGGSWSDDGRLFGHPLGGHGEETLVRVGFNAPERSTLVAVTGFTRQRRTYNLYAPEREGTSHGGSLAVEADGRAGWGLRVWASYEGGADWRTHQLHSAVSYRF